MQLLACIGFNKKIIPIIRNHNGRESKSISIELCLCMVCRDVMQQWRSSPASLFISCWSRTDLYLSICIFKNLPLSYFHPPDERQVQKMDKTNPYYVPHWSRHEEVNCPYLVFTWIRKSRRPDSGRSSQMRCIPHLVSELRGLRQECYVFEVVLCYTESFRPAWGI